MCNYYLGQYEEALAHYDIAMTKQPSTEDAGKIYYYKGLAFSSLRRYEEAIEAQQKAIEKTGDS